MHTSQTTHHRIFFTSGKTNAVLQEVMDKLCIEPSGMVDVGDLVQQEGNTLTIDEALYSTFPERLLKEGCSDAYDMSLQEIVIELAKIAHVEGIVPVSMLLHVDRYKDGGVEHDIDADELFDLLTILGAGHFKVAGIYSQYAVFSNKAQYGAHFGGTLITTPHFCLPCHVDPERAETVIRTLEKHPLEKMGDYFVNEFINPIMDTIRNAILLKAAESAFYRFATGSEPVDKGDVAGNEVPQ